MSGENKIPKHWKLRKLGDVLDIQGGSQPPKSTFIYEPKIGYVQLLQIRDFGKKGLPTYVPLNRVTKFCKKDDILIARYGASLGRIVTGMEGAYNVALAKVIDENKIFQKRYIFYLLKTQIFQTPLMMLSRSAQNGFSKGEIAPIELPIPPLPEQQAIAAKIEELLSELENGKQQLLTAQQQLKVYRQSLLKWAFVNTNFNDFVMKEATEKIQIGPFGTQLHKEDYITNGIPLINPMHIQDGNIQPNFSYSITKQKRDSLPNYILKEGDVIMGRRGEMGRCGLVRKKEIGWFCGTGSLYFRPHPKMLNSLFLYYYLSSQTVKKYLDENAGGTTMANLNLKIVNDIPISLPSLKEQQLIVDELESKLTVCDKIEETISQSLQQAEILRQSILKKAFEGKLV